ncbi:hypothetical protein E2C01_018511 [Portunus trituberculatus]|uniref:Uncharacterized protein n=1 Tax=Portunus trituberculatus TaxID=210409 RepID=A0A5B7DUM7_PORTR|nr:hypothetical protein [Portunus trituberculatus]
MILVHWWAEDTVPMDTVLEGTGFVEAAGVMVVEVPVGTGLQGVQAEEVPAGDVVVHDSSVVTALEDVTGPEIALGGTAVHGLREAVLEVISCVAGLVLHVGALGGQGPVDWSTFGWVVAVAGDPVCLGKGVGSVGQDCVAHHNNDYKFHGDFHDQLPWVHLWQVSQVTCSPHPWSLQGVKVLAEEVAAVVGAGLVVLQSLHTVAVMLAGKEPVKTMAAAEMQELLKAYLVTRRQVVERHRIGHDSRGSTGLKLYPAMWGTFSTSCHAHRSIGNTHWSLLLLGGHLTVVMSSITSDWRAIVAMVAPLEVGRLSILSDPEAEEAQDPGTMMVHLFGTQGGAAVAGVAAVSLASLQSPQQVALHAFGPRQQLDLGA